MDKWLDKLTDNRNFVKLVALVMALLLFGSVYDENTGSNEINTSADRDSVILNDIPVKSYYDIDNLVITGVPETVKVKLEGPVPNLQAARTQRDFEVYVDLSNAKVGNQRVKLQIKDLSDKLKANIEPVNIVVNVQEKITKEFTVEAEYNKNIVAEGYEEGAPVVKPGKVKITGAENEINKIKYVRAVLEVNGPQTSTVKKKATVTAFDENLSKLNVTIEEKEVEVTIPIQIAMKKVPISIVKKGSAPEGVTIDSITLDINEATITGASEILNKTDNVRVELDVSTISQNTELSLPVIISEGIKKVDPETVKATIKVTLNSETAITSDVSALKTFSNLPINIIGLSDGLTATIMDPSNGRTSLTLKGTNELIETVKDSDFQLQLDLTGLKEGEHKLGIDVIGPENTSWVLAIETATINITNNNT